MSAYIVDRSTVRFLVSVAQLWELYWHDGKESRRIHRCDDVAASKAGSMLWAENVRSVACRYPNSPNNLPGPSDRDYNYGTHRTAWSLQLSSQQNLPLQVFRALSEYEYQTCEHPEWPTSEAFTFCRMLRIEACRRLPGYDNADPATHVCDDPDVQRARAAAEVDRKAAVEAAKPKPTTDARFLKYSVTNSAGLKVRVRYYTSKTKEGTPTVCVHARDYGDTLDSIMPAESRNESDSMTDYFVKTHATIPQGHPLYDAALARVEANEARRAERVGE